MLDRLLRWLRQLKSQSTFQRKSRLSSGDDIRATPSAPMLHCLVILRSNVMIPVAVLQFACALSSHGKSKALKHLQPMLCTSITHGLQKRKTKSLPQSPIGMIRAFPIWRPQEFVDSWLFVMEHVIACLRHRPEDVQHVSARLRACKYVACEALRSNCLRSCTVGVNCCLLARWVSKHQHKKLKCTVQYNTSMQTSQ